MAKKVMTKKEALAKLSQSENLTEEEMVEIRTALGYVNKPQDTSEESDWENSDWENS